MNVALLAGALALAPAFGAPIADLYNTGRGTPGGVDPNWTVNGAPAFVTSTSAFPFPHWSTVVGGNWISPRSTYVNSTEPADTLFTFGTTFTLPDDFATAAIIVRSATDNALLAIRLNGTSIGLPTSLRRLPGNAGMTPVVDEGTGFRTGLGSTIRFDHTSGMVAGLNRLEFQVRNSATDALNLNNPTGLVATFESDFTLQQSDVALPEPSTMGLLAIGLAAFVCAAFHRRNTS